MARYTDSQTRTGAIEIPRCFHHEEVKDSSQFINLLEDNLLKWIMEPMEDGEAITDLKEKERMFRSAMTDLRERFGIDPYYHTKELLDGEEQEVMNLLADEMLREQITMNLVLPMKITDKPEIMPAENLPEWVDSLMDEARELQRLDREEMIKNGADLKDLMDLEDLEHAPKWV